MISEILITGIAVGITYKILKREATTLEKIEYNIEDEKIPKEFDNYKILQISDLHNKTFGKGNIKLIEEIDKINPDIIVITGDLVDGEKDNFKVALDLIDYISCKYKVVHVVGNHEQKSLNKKYKKEYKEYFRLLKDKDIIDLDNDMIKINKGSSYINLYGVVVPLEYYPYFFSNYRNKNKALDKNFMNESLGKIDKNSYNILLAHNPFFFENYSSWGADLVLSGHVHGGIIRIPKIGGVLSPNREFFPKYDLGEYNLNGSKMILSKGLGGSKVVIRINCKPEIVQINLKSKK